jgi:hypothetical protein
MQNFFIKINEFSNYLLENNVNKDKKYFINNFFVDSPDFTKINFVRFLKPQDDSEDKTVIEKDENGNDISVKKLSQISDLIELFGLNDTKDVKNKLNEFLNELLEFKKSLLL